MRSPGRRCRAACGHTVLLYHIIAASCGADVALGHVAVDLLVSDCTLLMRFSPHLTSPGMADEAIEIIIKKKKWLDY